MDHKGSHVCTQTRTYTCGHVHTQTLPRLRQAKLLVHFHSVSVLGPESTASGLTGTQPPNMYIL